MANQLSEDEKKALLSLARQALEQGVKERKLAKIDLTQYPPRLRQKGASFVTLTYKGNLRGCIGSLEPNLPLAEDVREHAVAAALQDYRFPPVRTDELDEIKIEISWLSPLTPISYDKPEELIHCIRPGIDGVVLRDGFHRATFLPQVWQKLSDPGEFLDHLCMKMGAQPDLWRKKKLEVFVYQVEEFHE